MVKKNSLKNLPVKDHNPDSPLELVKSPLRRGINGERRGAAAHGTRKKISWSDYSNAGSNCRKSRAESIGHFGIATASLWHTESVNLHGIARKSQLLFMPP